MASKRFVTTDFSTAPVELWNPGLVECGRGFRCIRSEFGSHYSKRVPRDVGAHLGRRWVIVDDGHLASFITLLADRLEQPGQGGLEL